MTKEEREGVALMLVACLVVALVFVFMMGCAPAKHPERPECADERLAAITTECLAREVALGCDSDPVNLCPDVVADCEKRIDEWERCQ